MTPPPTNTESISPAAHSQGDHDYKEEEAKVIRNDFLLQRTKIIKRDIDWKETPLPENEGLYATILDNAFTAQECESLIKQAETITDGIWEQAMINVGGGMQQMRIDTRDCGRIIWDDRDMVGRIWNRIQDSVPEIHSLKDMPGITGHGPSKRKEIWDMSRCNERMRFLKYGEGQYFRRMSYQFFESPVSFHR